MLLMSGQTLLYIDPGTGSLLLQVIAGGLIASLMFFKRIWINLTSFFRKKRADEPAE